MTPDQPEPYDEAAERYLTDAVFSARVKHVQREMEILGFPQTRVLIAIMLVIDERMRTEMASRRPDYSKEVQLLAQQAGYLDVDGEPTKKLRDALYGDAAWNTNPIVVRDTDWARRRMYEREFMQVSRQDIVRVWGAGPHPIDLPGPVEDVVYDCTDACRDQCAPIAHDLGVSCPCHRALLAEARFPGA